MSFAERLKEGPSGKKTRKSEIEVWLDSLSPEERSAADHIMSSPSWSHREVCEIIVSEGGPTTGTSNMGQFRRQKYNFGANDS